MENVSTLDWYKRELAQLQGEVALLRRLLGAITCRRTAHEDAQGPRGGHTTDSRPTPLAGRATQAAHHARLARQGGVSVRVTPPSRGGPTA